MSGINGVCVIGKSASMTKLAKSRLEDAGIIVLDGKEPREDIKFNIPEYMYDFAVELTVIGMESQDIIDLCNRKFTQELILSGVAYEDVYGVVMNGILRSLPPSTPQELIHSLNKATNSVKNYVGIMNELLYQQPKVNNREISSKFCDRFVKHK